MEHVRVLQDGFWERTAIVRDATGRLLVRKESTAAGADSPWGRTALREEIRFLDTVPGLAKNYYPPLVDHWDHSASNGSVGYCIPYYDGYENVSVALRNGSLSQADADQIQCHLADAILEATHQPASPFGIVRHVCDTIEDAITRLRKLPDFASCIDSAELKINECVMPGLSRAYDRARESPAMQTLGSLPTIRLHGDLILENILWNPAGDPPLRLIDPVSVAGISSGSAAFDLVKYASYATGELYALRSGAIKTGPTPGERDAFTYEPAPCLPSVASICCPVSRAHSSSAMGREIKPSSTCWMATFLW
ncbi:MAG: hypothetical protein R3F19_11740 [Verrucomicrobiales bacterium]